MRGVFGMGRVLLLALVLTGSAFPAWAADIRVHRETLKNGLTVQVVERPALPTVTVELAIPRGAFWDPPERAGVAAMVATLLTEGTTGRSANDIAEAIEFVGGQLSADAGYDYSSVSFQVLTRDLELGMDLLADVVRRPAFPENEVARVREEVLAGIKADEDRPGTVAAKAFDRSLFGDHPYARPVEGTLETVPAIDREALVAFHRDHYLPGNNAVINFVGDVKAKQAVKLTRKWLGAWQGASGPEGRVPAPPALSGVKLEVIDRPVAQANVVLGHLGIARSDPDFYPVVVMNYILGGGGFTSRLMENIRDKQGLAYSVYSGFNARTRPGSFAIRFQTKNESAGQAIKIALAEMRRIRDAPVSDQELADAKSYLTGSFPLRLDTNGKVAHLLTFTHVYGLGLTYFTDYVEQVAKVTADDVRRVARQYLHPDDMVWVVVADQDKARVKAP